MAIIVEMTAEATQGRQRSRRLAW